ALGWGCLFILWVLARWGMGALAVNGAEEISILLNTGAWIVVGYGAAVLMQNQYRNIVNAIVAGIVVMGLAQGCIALWQYFVSYQSSYNTLLKAIGNRPPDSTELALLYH